MMKSIIFIILSALVLETLGKEIIQINKLDELLTIKLGNADSKIVGGSPAQLGDYPWQGLFILDQGNGFASICGLSVLNEFWLITAAHCTEGASTSRIQVYLGLNRISTREIIGDLYTVSQIFDHPKFDNEDFENDLSLLQVSERIAMKDSVQAIALPVQGQSVAVGTDCVITGWGTTSEDGDVSDILQYAIVPVISNEQCRSWIGNDLGVFFPYDSQMCAGYISGGTDTCQGDSGGPLACNTGNTFILEGVTSFGIGCAQALRPGVYVRVSEYVDWIYGIIDEGSGIDPTTIEPTTTIVITTTSSARKLTASTVLLIMLLTHLIA